MEAMCIEHLTSNVHNNFAQCLISLASSCAKSDLMDSFDPGNYVDVSLLGFFLVFINFAVTSCVDKYRPKWEYGSGLKTRELRRPSLPRSRAHHDALSIMTRQH